MSFYIECVFILDNITAWQRFEVINFDVFQVKNQTVAVLFWLLTSYHFQSYINVTMVIVLRSHKVSKLWTLQLFCYSNKKKCMAGITDEDNIPFFTNRDLWKTYSIHFLALTTSTLHPFDVIKQYSLHLSCNKENSFLLQDETAFFMHSSLATPRMNTVASIFLASLFTTYAPPVEIKGHTVLVKIFSQWIFHQ